MKVLSINGIVNDGADYRLWLEQPFSQPGLKLEVAETVDDDPQVTAALRQARTMTLHVVVGVSAPGAVYTEAMRAPLREAALAALDTEATAVALVVSDNDGDHERYVYVVVQKVDEQQTSEGMGAHFVATLVTHRESRWRADTPRNETWLVDDSGDMVAITNNGSLPAKPVYTFRPTAAKSGAGYHYYDQKVFVPVPWTGANYSGFPMELTNWGQDFGGWDTAELVTNGDLVTESNIGVMVDGREVRRWITRFGEIDTKVWINLDFSSAAVAQLAAAMGSGDVVTSLTARFSIENFPQSGILRIDGEIFTYGSKNDLVNTFYEVHRAANGSDAAEHARNAVIEWLQHDIWIVYGPAGQNFTDFYELSPDGRFYVDYDGYKPMLNLAQSWNQQWVFDEFGTSVTDDIYRTAQWRPGGVIEGTSTEGNPYDQIIVGNADPGRVNQSWWTLLLAADINTLTAEGAGRRTEFVYNWDVSLRADGGNRIMTIPEPDTSVNELDWSPYWLEETYDPPIGLRFLTFDQRSTAGMEAALDKLTLYFADAPIIQRLPAIELYDLKLTLENVTTGQSITLAAPMLLDGQLAVDTGRHTVTLLDDGSNQYQALTRDTRRKEILPLAPGVNTLRATEPGMNGMTIYISFEERTYT